MNTTEAREAGKKAFADGRMAVPALNQAFIVAACKSATDTVALLDAYSEGWHAANLTELVS